MSKFALHTMVTVPHLDKGGVVVEITNAGTDPVYTVDFGYGDTHKFPESALTINGR